MRNKEFGHSGRMLIGCLILMVVVIAAGVGVEVANEYGYHPAYGALAGQLMWPAIYIAGWGFEKVSSHV